MSGASMNDVEDDPTRRKVRRNIHSCMECKRRKIRCQLSTENVAVCVGCHNRGITCMVQQAQREDNIPSAHFDEKLDRIESLLKRLVENGSSSTSAATPLAIMASQSSGSKNQAIGIANSASIGEGSPSDSFPSNVIPNHHTGVVQPREQNDPTNCRQSQKLEKIRRSLSNLLPSQHDADLIGASTNSWALAQVFCTPANDLFKNDDPLSSFNLTAVSKRHPTIIARTLLYIAICIQQLPPEFDMTRLHVIPSLDTLMEKYISAVITLVTSDDELVITIEGLECLLLQGLFQLNSGKLRRAWLTFRRALSITQMMCFDKDFMKSKKGVNSSSVKARKQMWHQVIMSDRYVSVLLGLPCGTEDDCFGPEETLNGANDEIDLIFERRLSVIAGHISKRNQAESSRINSQSQVIEEDMDRLAKDMPQEWWKIPRLDSSNRSRAVAQQFSRLTTQMWYYQLETLLHLPFMLRAATEHRYEYNKIVCMRASREILLRYLALRHVNNTQLLCRVVDFATFIASLTIILCLFQPSQESEIIRSQQQRDDTALLEEIILSMEKLARSSDREVVAKQSVEVLRALLKVNDTSGTSKGNLRLTIPYFGTISITRPAPIQNLDQTKNTPKFQGINVGYTTTSFQHNQTVPHQYVAESDFQGVSINSNLPSPPVASFTSTQFPWLVPEAPIENWEWQEEDTLFFDSLLSSDIGGFDSF